MMSSYKKDILFVLIKSLSKSEKRHFILNNTRGKKKKEWPIFVRLFEAMERQKEYDEAFLLEQIPDLKKRQLSNLKAHLYHHVLESIRGLERQKDIRIQIRELIDYAQVLYNKGLYRQSLKLLGKAKNLARLHEEIELKLQVVEFEKLIEARHITRSIENRAEKLSEESITCTQEMVSLSHLSNLSLSLYGMYLKTGHVRNENEGLILRSYFKNNLPGGQTGKPIYIDRMSFYEKVNLYQAYSWYAYILQDFLMFYRYSQKWVDLFETSPLKKKQDPSLYIKALNNLLTAHYFNQNHEKFKTTLSTLEQSWIKNKKRWNENTRTLAFVHTYTAKLNLHFLEGTFTEGLYLVPEILEQLEHHRTQIDQHRILVFYYKIASLYFGSGDNSSAIVYLNKIINLKIGNLRSDLQCFSRILHLIAHYELKNYDLTEYLSKSVYRFLEKNKDLSSVMEEIFQFLQKTNHVSWRGMKQAFIELKDRLEVIASNPYERRFFLYLDVISWLESKINRRPVQDVIREKFLNKVPRI